MSKNEINTISSVNSTQLYFGLHGCTHIHTHWEQWELRLLVNRRLVLGQWGGEYWWQQYWLRTCRVCLLLSSQPSACPADFMEHLLCAWLHIMRSVEEAHLKSSRNTQCLLPCTVQFNHDKTQRNTDVTAYNEHNWFTPHHIHPSGDRYRMKLFITTNDHYTTTKWYSSCPETINIYTNTGELLVHTQQLSYYCT